MLKKTHFLSWKKIYILSLCWTFAQFNLPGSKYTCLFLTLSDFMYLLVVVKLDLFLKINNPAPYSIHSKLTPGYLVKCVKFPPFGPEIWNLGCLNSVWIFFLGIVKCFLNIHRSRVFFRSLMKKETSTIGHQIGPGWLHTWNSRTIKWYQSPATPNFFMYLLIRPIYSGLFFFFFPGTRFKCAHRQRQRADSMDREVRLMLTAVPLLIVSFKSSLFSSFFFPINIHARKVRDRAELQRPL